MNSESGNTVLRLWLLLHRVRDALVACEDSVFKEYGLTTEQYGLLASVKSYGGSSRPIDLALLLERSPNSVSMLVDRMVKAGLVRRLRDRGDRRVVYVILTSKGQNIVEQSSPGMWEFIKDMLSPLSYEDRRTFLSLFEMINRKALEHLNPGRDIEGIVRDRAERHAELMKRVPAYTLTASPQSKRQVAKRKKAS